MKFYSFNQLPLYTDDFFWSTLNNADRDAMVVFNPADAVIVSPVFLRSRKSLEEHIEYICRNNVKKAIVIAENIDFLKQCTCLEYLMIFPAITAKDFDYSPLYELPNIKWLQCETVYGIDEDKICNIDYCHFQKLKRVGISGKHGHLNVHKAENVVSLFFDFGFPNSKTLTGFLPDKNLLNLSIRQAPIVSLDGLERVPQLQKLELSYNRRLSDISALQYLHESLKYLEIDTCGKIQDFSVLHNLHNLEFLILKGSNTLQNLSFIKNMPKLRYLHLTMNVADGDLSVCLSLSYAKIKNRKHYTHKDSELPKFYFENQIVNPFEEE